MVLKDANINIQPVLTKEQMAYEEAMKNMKLVTAKLKISQEGIDVDKLLRDQLEDVVMLFDETDSVQRSFNIEAQKLQQDANNKIRILQEDTNKKLGDIQNRYRILIEIMKTGAIYDCDIKGVSMNMSKEREDEIRKELETLANASDIEKRK